MKLQILCIQNWTNFPPNTFLLLIQIYNLETLESSCIALLSSDSTFHQYQDVILISKYALYPCSSLHPHCLYLIIVWIIRIVFLFSFSSFSPFTFLAFKICIENNCGFFFLCLLCFNVPEIGLHLLLDGVRLPLAVSQDVVLTSWSSSAAQTGLLVSVMWLDNCSSLMFYSTIIEGPFQEGIGVLVVI